jgi:hypothetical protein
MIAYISHQEAFVSLFTGQTIVANYTTSRYNLMILKTKDNVFGIRIINQRLHYKLHEKEDRKFGKLEQDCLLIPEEIEAEYIILSELPLEIS